MSARADQVAPRPAPSELFRALADDTRLRALMLLQAEGELCVCELTTALAVSQPKMSRHLAHLREAGLVTGRRDGLWIHYRIATHLPDWVAAALAASCAGLAGEPAFAADRRRLAALDARPGARCPVGARPRAGGRAR